MELIRWLAPDRTLRLVGRIDSIALTAHGVILHCTDGQDQALCHILLTHEEYKRVFDEYPQLLPPLP